MVMHLLMDLEHRGWRSLCDGTGDAVYGELMTDDALMVLAHGRVLDRRAVVASLDGAPPWASYAIEHARVVPMGGDAAALVYLGTAVREDGVPFVAWMTSVYVRRDGGWGLALHQQTPADTSAPPG